LVVSVAHGIWLPERLSVSEFSDHLCGRDGISHCFCVDSLVDSETAGDQARSADTWRRTETSLGEEWHTDDGRAADHLCGPSLDVSLGGYHEAVRMARDDRDVGVWCHRIRR